MRDLRRSPFGPWADSMPEPLAKLKRLYDRHRRPALSSALLALLGLFAALQAWLGAPSPVGAVRVEPTRPVGVLVPVGGHRLHLNCTGEGAPTVILEAGIGGSHLDWIRAQPGIGGFTRVCSYDRAGYGWSERGPKPRTVSAIAGELRSLIRNADIETPVVLVGHSFGGLISLYYASRFADEVAGLVLVDSMHPDQYDRFPRAGVRVPTEPARGVITASRPVLTYGIPAEWQDLAYALASSDKSRSYMLNELRNVLLSVEQVRDAGLPAGPSRVLVHGNREWDRIYTDGRMEDLWLDLQSELAAAIGAPDPVIARDSGHQLPLDDPASVVGAVRDLVVRINRSPPAPGPRDRASRR